MLSWRSAVLADLADRWGYVVGVHLAAVGGSAVLSHDAAPIGSIGHPPRRIRSRRILPDSAGRCVSSFPQLERRREFVRARRSIRGASGPPLADQGLERARGKEDRDGSLVAFPQRQAWGTSGVPQQRRLRWGPARRARELASWRRRSSAVRGMHTPKHIRPADSRARVGPSRLRQTSAP
jgi:hypothetical protein